MILSDKVYEEVGAVFDSIFNRKITTSEEWNSRTLEFTAYLGAKGLKWEDWTETLEYRINTKSKMGKGNV